MISESRYAAEKFCYLTTIGRVSGKPHEIEIWFAFHGNTLYMLSGGRGRSDWVKNIRSNPAVRVRIGGAEVAGTARVVEAGTDEDALARRLLQSKYQPSYGSDLSEWARASLPIRVDLEMPQGG